MEVAGSGNRTGRDGCPGCPDRGGEIREAERRRGLGSARARGVLRSAQDADATPVRKEAALCGGAIEGMGNWTRPEGTGLEERGTRKWTLTLTWTGREGTGRTWTGLEASSEEEEGRGEDWTGRDGLLAVAVVVVEGSLARPARARHSRPAPTTQAMSCSDLVCANETKRSRSLPLS